MAKIADPATFHELLVSGMSRNRAWNAGLVLTSPSESQGAQ
ncbi:hypothetical protein [Streptomyces sp. NPDC004685]